MACRGNKRIMGGQEEGGKPKRPEGWRNWKTQRGMEGTEVREEVSRAAEPWGTVAVREVYVVFSGGFIMRRPL